MSDSFTGVASKCKHFEITEENTQKKIGGGQRQGVKRDEGGKRYKLTDIK